MGLSVYGFHMNCKIVYYVASIFLLGLLHAAANKCAQPNFKNSEIPKEKVKWAIVALTKHGRYDINPRNRAIVKILKPYAHLHDITAIFFSETKFPVAVIEEAQTVFQPIGQVKFVNTADRGFAGKEKFGYKYMCKFFSLDMYDYLKEYDYYMRVDSDCTMRTMNYDILQWAHTAQVEYGFAMRKIEAHQPTREQLPKFVENYLAKCEIEATAQMDNPLTTCFNFYNNWHIGKVSFFLRADVHHFLESVNASGRILSDRWGDSTIQAYAVRMFMEPQHIIQVPEFVYVHGSHDKIVSTFGDGKDTNVPQRLPNWKASG